MAYELINQEMNLWSCRLQDLTAEEVNSFLKQWEEGAKIGSLTVFYEPKKDMIVVNKDSKDFDRLVWICEKWMSKKPNVRDIQRPKFKEQLVKEIIRVLDGAIRKRENDRILTMLENQPNVPDEYDFKYSLLDEIFRKYKGDHLFIASTAFKYGIMQGKRMERARRKRGRKL